MTRALISGNCLRYDIAAQLSAWLPGLEVTTGILPDVTDAAAMRHLSATLATTDLWIVMGSAEDAEKALAGLPTSDAARPAVCRIPVLGFAAFHPDICFAVNVATGHGAYPVFHSAIAAWAYQHGLSVPETTRLFTTDNFKALGYLDAWQPSVTYLKRAFAASDLAEDFSTFFYAVKRMGCFMHTFNHPTPSAIATLCALICQRTGLKPVSQHTLPVSNSPASRVIWPVYPGIAERLGVGVGHYVWQQDGVTLEGLSAFLTGTFEQYRAQGIAPGQLRFVNRDEALMDHVLGQKRAAA